MHPSPRSRFDFAGSAGCITAVVLVLSLAACRHDTNPAPGALSCTPPPVVPTRTYPVNLKIRTGEDGLARIEVLEASQCVNRPTEKGCVDVQRQFQGDIKFVLVGGKTQECTGSGTDNWRLDHVTLANSDKAFGDPVSQDVQCDFETDANGRVLSPSFQGVSMTVHDDNRTAYDAYYQVTAVNCADPSKTAVTDPMIRNEGTN